MTDMEFLERRVAQLEAENRSLRKSLEDEFAKAALAGFLAGLPGPVNPEMQKPLAAGLWSMAKTMVEMRGEG